jgi:hypothetical protein
MAVQFQCHAPDKSPNLSHQLYGKWGSVFRGGNVESTTAGVCSVQQLSRVEKRSACETSLCYNAKSCLVRPQRLE